MIKREKVDVINVANNLRQRPVVGSVESNGVGVGQFNITGSITMYFENIEAYELFLDGDETDLSFTIGGASEMNYQFDIPRLKFDDADVPTPANNQDIFITLPFEGLYDSSDDCSFMITRTPAAYTLDMAFNTYLLKAQRTDRVDLIKMYSNIAFKAQRQCRQSAEALAEIKNPKPYNVPIYYRL